MTADGSGDRASPGDTPVTAPRGPLPRGVALAIAGLLAIYVAWLVVGYRYHFIDGVNLLIHEAGHVLFSPLGQVIGVLGGTLLQLAFPVAFVVHFTRRGRTVEALVCGVWAAESLMYTALYMGDAVRQELPLVGGHLHDWNFLLGRAGLLGAAEGLALTLRFVAALAAILAVALVLRTLLARPS